jgi:DNA replication and repair protein RecF
MQLRDIVLKDFRNYENLSLSFSPLTNFIVGPNGAGKTNILEAISVLSNLRSFRNSNDVEIIRWGCSTYYCSCSLTGNENNRFEVAFTDVSGVHRKKFQIDANVLKNHSDYYGRLLTVILSPSDILLVQGVPEFRRKYFDSIISKFDNKYLLTLNDFRKTLFNRNKLLKLCREKGTVDTNGIDVWDQLFAENASYLITARMNFAQSYDEYFQNAYMAISEENNLPALMYRPSMESSEPGFIIQELQRNRSKELRYGSTVKGPQRDDYYFLNRNNILFTHYASQGQRRTAAIALKIAERDYIQNLIDKKCIVLMDDIFSELDAERQKNMVALVNTRNQLIITMVNSNSFAFNNLDMDRLFLIDKKGLITQQ